MFFIENSQNAKNFHSLQLGDRIHLRFKYQDQWSRIVIIKTPPSQVEQSYKKMKIIYEPSKFQIQARKQFQLHKKINNKYILKNKKIKIFNGLITFIQQDYLCLLSQFSLSELNLKNRIQLFQSIVKSLKALHDELICLRSLNPTIIAIFIQDGKYYGKIRSLETALIFQNKKDINKDGKARILAIKTNNMMYTSPQIRQSQKHGFSSDIWSLGVLFNYILYETTENIIQKDNTVQIIFPSDTPNWVADFLKSMLKYDSNQRATLVTVLQIIRTASKCLDVLEKCIPFGKIIKKQNKPNPN